MSPVCECPAYSKGGCRQHSPLELGTMTAFRWGVDWKRSKDAATWLLDHPLNPWPEAEREAFRLGQRWAKRKAAKSGG